MKVQYGKWIYTKPDQIVQQFDRYEKKIKEHETKLELIGQWADRNLHKHYPYISGRIDLSISPDSERKARFLKAVERNLFCAECRTSWPCARIEELKLVKELSRTFYDEEQIATIEEKIGKIVTVKKQSTSFGEDLYL